MATIFVVFTFVFLGVFGYLNWETNRQDAREKSRRHHPSYKGW